MTMSTPVLVAKKHTPFDLAKMKRLFGGPALIGDETMEDFDEFAAEMVESLQPGDAAAHVLAYQYILESHWYMRLLRFRGHSNRYRNMSAGDANAAARRAMTSGAEAKAFLGLEEALDMAAQINFLIAQALKRLGSLLLQLAMHRAALADSFRKALEREELGLEIELKSAQVRLERELQARIAEKEQAQHERRLAEREEYNRKRKEMQQQHKANAQQTSPNAEQSGSDTNTAKPAEP
jgi:hypothetical protein